MNARAVSNHQRDFFTDIVGNEGETAAKDIYDYIAPRLKGATQLRHPEEMPFAESDFARAKAGLPVVVKVVENDANHVRHGSVNSVLSVIETSRVIPEGAGLAKPLADGSGVEFRPSANFEGIAWFSYTLRGSVGNDLQGWLHKGDVAVDVESEDETDADALRLRLRPGASYSFFPRGGTRNWTQPQQALVHRSDDDGNLLIVRVNADATGRDSFRVRNDTYTITYSDEPPRAVPDLVWIDRYRRSITIDPLANDEGAGFLWLHEIAPLVGAGTVNRDVVSSHFFPTSMVLKNVANLEPRLGQISLEQLPVTVNGEPKHAFTGRIVYLPEEDADGTGGIDYTMTDASGREVTGRISVQIDNGHDTLISPDSQARIGVPQAENVDAFSRWAMPNFSDATWDGGPLGVGYETNTGYEGFIGTDVRDEVLNRAAGVYVRVPFEVPATAAYSELGFRARYDDGFAVYLNGRKVLAKNAPADLTWHSFATESDEHRANEAFYVADLSAHRDLLSPGRNLLAIHVLNDDLASSDLLMQPALVAYPKAPEAPEGSPLSVRFREWQAGFDELFDGNFVDSDYDDDSFSSLVEFAAGTSPVDASDRPVLVVNAERAGVRMTVVLRFLRRIDAELLQISYVLEQAETGNVSGMHWEEIDLERLRLSGGSVAATPLTDGVEAVVVRIPLDVRDVDAKYYRIRYELVE